MFASALALLLTSFGQISITPAPNTANPGAQALGGASQPYLNGAALPGGSILEATPAGRVRFQSTLRIEELTGDRAQAALKAIDVDFGKPTIAERWLLEALRMRSLPDRLDRVEMSETLTAHPVGDSIVLRRVRAIEGDGSVVSASAARGFVERFLRANDALVQVDITIATSKVTAEAAPEVRVTPLDVASVASKRAEFEKHDGTDDVLMAPSLSLYAGQRGQVRTQSEEIYIKDYEILESDGKQRAFPIVDKLPSGLEFSIQAVIDPDRATVRSELSLEIRELARPVRKFRTTLENGESVTLDLPEWSTTSWSSSDLETSETTPGFLITGLRTRVKNANAPNGELRDVTILGSVRKLAGLGEIADSNAPPSMVIGYDPTTRRAFVKTGTKILSAQRIEIVRSEKTVGSGVVIESIGDILVIELKTGEAAAGDRVK